MTDLTTRAAATRQRILEAALEAFIEHGYRGANLDQVAATAAVSKQTIYKQFADKERLFHAIITDIGEAVDDPFAAVARDAAEAPTAEAAIEALARQFVTSIMTERVLQIRRLIIAEAPRFPDLGRSYWERGFDRVLSTLSACLRRLHERGLLDVPDPLRASDHLAGLLLWIPSNRAMFLGPDAVSAKELTKYTADGVTAFLAAYTPRT